jgi:uncharacterized damage-inducible protein DinB
MSWTELLKREVEDTYKATEGLIDLIDEDRLDWKPSTGSNWMTMGQLVLHITGACGGIFKGFVTGDWGFPPDVDPSKMSKEEMLPPAEKLPTIGNLSEAKKLLAEDKQTALKMLAEAGENDLTNKITKAPWDPNDMILGHRLLHMVGHLTQHKGQLFYYLKLQGKPVNTGHLWGM